MLLKTSCLFRKKKHEELWGSKSTIHIRKWPMNIVMKNTFSEFKLSPTTKIAWKNRLFELTFKIKNKK